MPGEWVEVADAPLSYRRRRAVSVDYGLAAGAAYVAATTPETRRQSIASYPIGANDRSGPSYTLVLDGHSRRPSCHAAG